MIDPKIICSCLIKTQMPYIAHCGSLPFGWELHNEKSSLHNGETTAQLLSQSCAKDPTHRFCPRIAHTPISFGNPAYKSCGILPSLDIPFLGKTLASKPVADAVRDHVNYCKTFYNTAHRGHIRTCDFVGVQTGLHGQPPSPPPPRPPPPRPPPPPPPRLVLRNN